MSFWAILGIAAGVIWLSMTALWVVSLRIKNASIVDIFWGAGFVMTGWLTFALTEGVDARKWLLMALVTIWGLRLAITIGRRNAGKGEDFRYARWREENGSKWWWVSYFQVFMLQGALMLLISTPLLKAQFDPIPSRLTVLDGLAVVVWGVGFFFEAVGDAQLARFKADPANKGRVLDRGVWRYTRHPNYFGDAMQWWAYGLIALGSPLGFLTLYAPLLMTLLLTRVSGVALLEKTLAVEKPQYRDYIERTSAFVPWFPRTTRRDTP
jgi:steroid 5-alpha reductase family enzyme